MESAAAFQRFRSVAGAPIPAGTTLNGVNLLPFLAGEQAGSPHDILFWKNGENGAVRQGDWKLFLSPWAPKRQLFNLAADIGEKTDLAAEKPELTEALHRAWLDWSASLPPRANPQEAKAAPGAAAARPAQDRAAIFAQKDKDGNGRLTREEFLANQADVEAAKVRLSKWDTDQDGHLSRDEFIRMGGRSP